MTTRALVLGGGGTVGIAWELGVLAGLHEQGLDLGTADMIIGTSAGSVVGTQVALGLPLPMLLATQLAPSDGSVERALVFDPQTFSMIMTRWGSMDTMTPAAMAEIGKLALAAHTVAEDHYLQIFAATLHGVPWPQRQLRITAVDTEAGEFVAWDSTAGVPLTHAVAASCAVPGLFPPVTINGRRYMDGSVRSATSVDLARGMDVVVVIAPIVEQTGELGALASRQLADEVAALRDAGALVELVLPDAVALEAFGLNLMDPARRTPAVHAGQAQGRAAAAQLRGVWER